MGRGGGEEEEEKYGCRGLLPPPPSPATALLASCRKRTGVASQGAYLVLSLVPALAPLYPAATPELVLGKLRSDWAGGLYTAYDAGISPAKAAAAAAVGVDDGAAASSGGAGSGRRRRSSVAGGAAAAAAATLRRELACVWFKYDNAGPGSMQ